MVGGAATVDDVVEALDDVPGPVGLTEAIPGVVDAGGPAAEVDAHDVSAPNTNATHAHNPRPPQPSRAPNGALVDHSHMLHQDHRLFAIGSVNGTASVHLRAVWPSGRLRP